MLSTAGFVLLSTLSVLFIHGTSGQCGVSCPACERRYGCMTESWGRCCVQFYQPNGKRSAAQPDGNPFHPPGNFWTGQLRNDPIPHRNNGHLRKYTGRYSGADFLTKANHYVSDFYNHGVSEKVAKRFQDPTEFPRISDSDVLDADGLNLLSTESTGQDSTKLQIQSKMQNEEKSSPTVSAGNIPSSNEGHDIEQNIEQISNRIAKYLKQTTQLEDSTDDNRLYNERGRLEKLNGNRRNKISDKIKSDYAKILQGYKADVDKRRISESKIELKDSAIPILYNTQRIRRALSNSKPDYRRDLIHQKQHRQFATMLESLRNAGLLHNPLVSNKSVVRGISRRSATEE